VQIVVIPSDELPIYRQIMRQITEAIAGGRLKPGDKLPSHRDLAEQIVVAPLTVKKAYVELEAIGLIETQRGRGTYIPATLPEIDRDGQLGRIRGDARKLLSQAYLAGIDLPEMVSILREADREIKGRQAIRPPEANLPGNPREEDENS
jgi:GntR family transcriptional regulator